MTISKPLLFYDLNGPGFQAAVLSEFEKLGGSIYPKSQSLYYLWKDQKIPSIASIIELGKDFAMIVFHIPSIIKSKISNEQMNTVLTSISDQYSEFFCLLQGFNQLPYNHLLNSIILNSTINDHISWIPSRHAKDTALCLRSAAKRFQIEDKPPSMARVKEKWKTFDDAQLDLLQGLLLTGKKKAKILQQHISNPINLIKRIVNGDSINIKGFGPEFVEKNKQLLLKKYEN